MLKEAERQFLYEVSPSTWVEREIGLELDPWQKMVLDSDSKRLIMNCSRQSGKSTIAALKSLHRCIYKPGSLAVLLSPSQDQSKELLVKLKDAYTKLPNLPPTIEESKEHIIFMNKSRILSLPGTERSSRGYSAPSMIIVDEAAQVSDLLYKSIRPMLSVGQGDLMILSTPRGRHGFFHDLWTNDDPSWVRASIDADSCPRITAEFLAEEEVALGPAWYRQEYFGEFIETAGGIFDHDLLADVFVSRSEEESGSWLDRVFVKTEREAISG